MIKECVNCHAQKTHHARGLCYACYKKLNWVPRMGQCKRCSRKMEIHAKGFCAGCYNYLFHVDKNKAYHHRKQNKIDLKTYKEVTRMCAACGFDKVVDMHHLDRNRQNSARDNLVGLCPNHHRMIRSVRFRSEVYQLLSEKGVVLPSLDGFSYKNQGSGPNIKRSLLEFT